MAAPIYKPTNKVWEYLLPGDFCLLGKIPVGPVITCFGPAVQVKVLFPPCQALRFSGPQAASSGSCTTRLITGAFVRWIGLHTYLPSSLVTVLLGSCRESVARPPGWPPPQPLWFTKQVAKISSKLKAGGFLLFNLH